MSQDLDRELARLYRVTRTVHEMLADRGYNVDDKWGANNPFHYFQEQHGSGGSADRNSMCFSADHLTDAGDRVYVYFCAEKSVSKASIKTFIGSVERMQAKRGILIHPDKLSSVAGKAIQEMQAEFNLEAFKEADLLVNITQHFLVPKHTIMKPEEKTALLKRYRLKDTQLPRIMKDDPVAKYYGMKRGQVMKIERSSETAGRYITYRICM
ncbi:RNA polymerase Rpb5, C-terminal domain-containing protein [Papiliotrema laurentii]|uniref:DNA-directed RNA polymerases I, II, and III subunit RPABC1 n=1 Tax=Papiliotrema laurentii TaxID=5418 RepID=A0AAD9CWV0_PAPLA|nr:RNA polymerase Rpb5, C-terminal domain-containing protein [Papiliotrema laurentii]